MFLTIKAKYYVIEPHYMEGTYTLENMVFGNVPVLYTLAWMFYKRGII